MISRFDGENKFLSNFYPVTIVWKGIKFPTVEHAYVASKSTNPLFWEYISKFPAKKAGFIKGAGRELKDLRPNWDEVKVDFMEQFLRKKFSNAPLRTKLFLTYSHEIIEGNYWHDNFWGSCSCNRCLHIDGQNMLGKLIMKIREEIYEKEDSDHRRPSQRV
jgi:ribA/ribD-fused uncharacterized protein